MSLNRTDLNKLRDGLPRVALWGDERGYTKPLPVYSNHWRIVVRPKGKAQAGDLVSWQGPGFYLLGNYRGMPVWYFAPFVTRGQWLVEGDVEE